MFYDLLPLLNFVLACGSLVLLAVTAILFINYKKSFSAHLDTIIKNNLWQLIIVTSVGGVILSLVYSEYFLFVPCSLCWLQRIALYPQALLAIVAFVRKDTVHFPVYGIALSMFGFLVAFYQYIYQMLPKEAREGFAPCLVDGSNADCAVKIVDLFGFVTFPFISAATFVFLITLYLYLKRVR